MNTDLELLEFLKYILDCEYISDLTTKPYNRKARLLLNRLDLNRYYNPNQIKDAFEYIYK